MDVRRLAAVALSAVAGAVAPAYAAEEGGGASLIEPQTGTIFWTLVTFVLLIVFLGRFAWKPLLGAVAAREQALRDSLEQARREREEAQSILAQQRALLVEARQERAGAQAQGQRDGEALKAEILEQAKQQRAQLLKQTQDQLDASLRQARAEIRVLASDLAIRAAEKLVRKNLDDATQRKLVEDYLAELERSAGSSGGMPS